VISLRRSHMTYHVRGPVGQCFTFYRGIKTRYKLANEKLGKRKSVHTPVVCTHILKQVL
jgi:hypothetical protein